jgi:hypothetical protein
MPYHWKIPLLLVIAVGSWTGCETLGATPAELSKPQILAIRADPPAIQAGQTSTLSILVADPDGVVANPDVTWTLTTQDPDEQPLGTLTGDGYTAPATIAEESVVELVEARVLIAGEELIASKVISVGTNVRDNPALVGFTADGADVLATGTLTLTTGQTTVLSVDIGADIRDVAWYATVGSIEQYRSTPAELVAPDEPGSGWLIAVVRDAFGGVVWQAIAVTVQ